MAAELDIFLPDGRLLHVHDTGPVGPSWRQDRGTLLWQTGSPQTGALLDDGHISILRTLPLALDWLVAR